MAGNAAPSKAHRKRILNNHQGGGEKTTSSSKRQSDDSVSESHAAILRGALDFRDRTGLPLTTPNMEAFYESVKDSLPVPLSKDQVNRRLRHIRRKFEHSSAGDGDHVIMKLAAQLWPSEDVEDEAGAVNDQKKEKRRKIDAPEGVGNARKEVVGVSENGKVENNKGKELKAKQELVDREEVEEEDEAMQDKNEGERGIQPECFPYITHNIEAYWKGNGLSKASLEIGMKHADRVKANILENKWKRYFEDEMKFEMEWAKMCKELFAMILATHKVGDGKF